MTDAEREKVLEEMRRNVMEVFSDPVASSQALESNPPTSQSVLLALPLRSDPRYTTHDHKEEKPGIQSLLCLLSQCETQPAQFLDGLWRRVLIL